MESITGSLGRVRFHKVSEFSDSGNKYIIANFEIRNSENATDAVHIDTDCPEFLDDVFNISNDNSQVFQVVVKGEMNSPVDGWEYTLYGEWKEDKYGKHFSFFSFEPKISRSNEGMADYLARSVPQVGKVYSRSIIDYFGEDSFKILKTEPSRIHEVKEIKEFARHAVEDWFLSDNASEVDPAAYARLYDMLVSIKPPRKIITSLLKNFGSNAPQFVSENPYRLLDYPGIGWDRVDRLATSVLKYPKKGLERHRSAVLEVLARNSENGHTKASVDSVVCDSIDLVKVQLNGECVSSLDTDRMVELSEDKFISLIDLFIAERTIAEEIARISASPTFFDNIADDGLLDEQKLIPPMIESNSFSIISGVPGSGKSYSVARMIRFLYEKGINDILVCCPTGKAAKRNSEFLQAALPGVDIPCMTIHRALKAWSSSAEKTGVPETDARTNRGRDKFAFQFNRENQLPYEVFIMDECFPVGTLIDTPRGLKKINELIVGDSIINAFGVDTVAGISKKEVTKVVKITVGEKEIFSSELHRFFTIGGLKFACELKHGDSILQTKEAMRLLRKNPREIESRSSKVLQSLLQRELVDEFSRTKGKNQFFGKQEKKGRRKKKVASIRITGSRCSTGKSSQFKTVSIRRCKNEDIFKIERNWTSSKNPRRKWKTAYCLPRKTFRVTWKYVDSRIRSSSWKQRKRLSFSLQARLSESRNNDMYRIRRRKSLLTKSERKRFEKNQEITGTRVDSVEILESRDSRLDGFRNEEGKLYFYDIKAKRHQSFSVNKLLVHNCSMTDVELMASFLKAVPTGSTVVIVGDKYQLPSVGPGSVLRDMLSAGIPSVILDKPRRNSGMIAHACYMIKEGRNPHPDILKEEFDGEKANWTHAEIQSDHKILDFIVEAHKNYISRNSLEGARINLQVISPEKKGILGCNNLNKVLGSILNPGQVILSNPKDENSEPILRVGDKIVRTRNGEEDLLVSQENSNYYGEQDIKIYEFNGTQYELHVCYLVNGDTGHIVGIEKNHIMVKFSNPDRLCRLTKGSESLSLAYALTVHKMQGSSAPIVICPLTNYYWNPKLNTGLWSRELCYTMFSRPSERLITVGRINELYRAISRVTIHQRKTRLAEMIKDARNNKSEV